MDGEFYGSKSGIRQLAQQSRAVEPDLMMPDGIIASGVIDASRIAANKYIKERGVVLKTNKGHAGVGVLLFKKEICQLIFMSVSKRFYQF